MWGVRVVDFVVSSMVAILIVAAIGYFNFSLIRNHFIGDFNQNIASIEISYIQMAKFWSDSGGSLWQPLWYLGYPWHVFYTPLLPFLELIFHNLFDFSFAHAYRVLTGIGYVIAPISTFFFVWQIAKSKSGAAISAFVYSIVPSLIAFLFNEVAQDSISGMLEPRRFTILVRWGEGPHTLALAFVPVFGLFVSRYLESFKFRDLLFASIFLGIAALTNAIALWACAVLLLAFVIGKMAESGANVIAGGNEPNFVIDHTGGREIAKQRDSHDFVKITKKVVGILFLTWGLVAFWYNPASFGTFFAEGGGAFSNWAAMFPWGILVLVVAAVGIFMLVKKFFGKLAGLPFSVFWFLMMFGIVYTYYASGDSHLEYVPQALRLNTEADLAFSVLVGVTISRLFLFLISMESYGKIVGWISASIVVSVCALPIGLLGFKLLGALPEVTKPLEQSQAGDITKTAEYKVATRLKELSEGTDQRVFAPGNYGFWLNFFEPVPQIRGALYQSSTHFWPEHIYYQVTNGNDGNISLAWLKIANIGKLVFTTIGSGETYKDYKVPQDKFDRVLKQISNESGDVFFDVPLANDSLAKVVDARTLEGLKRPFNAIDDQPINEYVDWIEQYSDRKIKFSQLRRDHYRITGEVREGEAVLIQSTYDSGWSVKQNRGQTGEWKIKRDPFDFMVLIPKRGGQFEADLVYGKPLVVYFGYLVTFMTIGFIVKRVFAPDFVFRNPFKRQ